MTPSLQPMFSRFSLGKIFYPMAARRDPDLADAGYELSEWAMSGEALSYATDAVPADGRVELREADSAPYATRLLVRRPRPEAFSGVVVVEWLNVSGGQDASPGWTYTAEEIMRAGHVWIGVSAQYIAVEGGGAAVGMGGQTQGLRTQRPERYDGLHHPGDAYAYDIVTQLARYVRALAERPGAESSGSESVSAGTTSTGVTNPDSADVELDDEGTLLGGLRPTTVLALGQSQSAYALTSYVNGVHPLVDVFDGFLLHSRGAGTLPYDDRGRGSDITEVLTTSLETGPVLLRDDLSTPVMVLQAEGDLGFPLYSAKSRQPDTDHLVTWEVAGQSHADLYLIGEFAQFVDCGAPVNNGQQAFVLRAALRHLVSWAGGGARPPSAPRVELDDDDEVIHDDLGLARGGVRPPAVEAPVELLTGAPASDADPLCMLLGRTLEMPEGELSARWTGRGEYLETYRDATDRLIEKGFLLPEDREVILADVRPERLGV